MRSLYSRLKTSSLLLLCLALLSTRAVYSQSTTVDARNFINNVVEIGLSDFGLVTGEDSSRIYFIAVRHTLNEKSAPAEPIAASIKTAKFYNGAYRAKATKLQALPFGAFTIVLYEAARPKERKWQSNFYHSLEYKRGDLSTLRDKWMSDKIWSIHSAKINVQKTAKDGVSTLKVPKDAGIAKGMPLINSEGFIAGMMAESSLGKTTVRAIDLDKIAEALYKAGEDCRYFNLIEWGQTETRCVIELKARLAAEEKARLEASKKDSELEKKNREQAIKDSLEQAKLERKEKRQPRQHFLDYGIQANFLPGPLQVPGAVKDNYFRTRVFNAGVVLYLNLDKKHLNRITIKPRYGEFFEQNDPGLWTSPDEALRIISSTYKYVEMPIVLERKLFQAKSYSIAIGAGYSGGYVFKQQYNWTDKSSNIDNRVDMTPARPAIMHRLLGELYLYESKIGRLGLIYAKDLSGYPNSEYILNHAGTDYTLFADRNKGSYLGLELQIRLRGKW